jgi:hypothetical protein
MGECKVLSVGLHRSNAVQCREWEGDLPRELRKDYRHISPCIRSDVDTVRLQFP